MKQKVLSALALLFAAAVILRFAAPTYRQGEPTITGSKAPDFAYEANGAAARLADLRGKVVVLNFWATWCPPCVQETPALNRLQRVIAPRGGVVLGISVDEDAAAYDKFLQAQQISFPTYRDPTKKISARYGTFMYPETYIITKDGRIARKVIGAQDWTSSEWLTYLDNLLGGK